MTDAGADRQIERVNAYTIALTGEFDLSTAGALRRALEEAADAASGEVRVHMSAVTFLDSTTVGLLIASRQRLSEAGDRLVIVDCSPIVRRLFEMLGLLTFLTFDDGC